MLHTTLSLNNRNLTLRSTAFDLMLFVSSQFAMADSYRVTTLRASPGKLEALVNQVKAFRSAQNDVIILRHSQGDHWDLVLLEPDRSTAGEYRPLVDFQLSFIADSISAFTEIKREARDNGLYHIEMFHALAGKHDALSPEFTYWFCSCHLPPGR